MSGFRFFPPLAKIFRRMSANVRAVSQTANTGMDAMSSALNPDQHAIFLEGTVIRSGVGWYDLAVNVPNYGLIGCSILANMASNLYGVSECSLPVEGSRVLVYMASPRTRYGVVMGVLPSRDFAPIADESRKTTYPGYAPFFDLESYGSVGSELAYHQPLSDDKNHAKVHANASRPLDVLPGMHIAQNEQAVGLGVTPLAATIKATDRAQVRVSPIDDNVRIVSGFFQHFNAAGSVQCFNDGGFVTTETSVSGYQCERSGENSIGSDIFEKGDTYTLQTKSKTTSLKKKKPRSTNRKRFQSFVGFLGDIVNIFVAKPDPDIAVPETEDAKNKDQGLFQTHVDSGGRLIVRAAGGILLQRWDRIPVPKRLRQPWDPEGDKVEDDGDPQEKKPFEWPDDHPYGRSLQLRDANAWRCLGAYWRLHNSSESTGKKDFYIPEEDDMRVPDNEYDGPGKGREEYGKYDKRQAGLAIEDDGSIVIRDAWGSEIVMRGGNIVLNAAGQIDVRAGKSAVVMAGADAVIRGRYSVDIGATERDVRIKADRNLHMLAEGRTGGGGILLESKAEGDSGQWEKKGEEARSKGIVLKAKESRVFATAKSVHLSGEKRVMLEGFGEDSGSNDGEILLSARNIRSHANRQTMFATGDGACVYMSETSAFLVGRSAFLFGGHGAGVARDSRLMVPLMWAPISSNPYDAFRPVIEKIGWNYLQKTEWLAPYTPQDRKHMRFTYRSSKEYGTMRGTEIHDAATFYVYQPFWSVMARAGSEFVPVTPEGWKEYEIDGTKPWPGKEAEASSYVKLDTENNVEAATGISKRRSSLTPKSGSLSPAAFDEYEVVPHE